MYLGPGIGLRKRLVGGRPTNYQMAQAILNPTTKTTIFGIGDSRQANLNIAMPGTAGIPWIGVVKWGSLSTFNSAGIYNTTSVGPPPNAAPISPIIGGPETWFPNGDIESVFLGGNTLGNALNTRLAAVPFFAADFPLIRTSFPGYEVRFRSLIHRRAGAPSSVPGVRLIANFTGGVGFTLPNRVGSSVFDLTGSGYLPIEIAIPNTHNWSLNPQAGMDVTVVPLSATVNGEAFAYHQIWIETTRVGVVLFMMGIGGAAIERWIDNSIVPLSIWSEMIPAVAEGNKVIFWIDIGTNNPNNNTIAQHEAKLRTLISRLRTVYWDSYILLTTAYPRDLDGPTTYYETAAINIGATTPGVLIINTFPMVTYAQAVTNGWMADTVHYNAAGNAAFSQRIVTALQSIQ